MAKAPDEEWKAEELRQRLDIRDGLLGKFGTVSEWAEDCRNRAEVLRQKHPLQQGSIDALERQAAMWREHAKTIQDRIDELVGE